MRTAAVVDLAVNSDRRQLRWTSVRSPYRSRVLPRRTVTRLGVYSKAVSLTRESDAVANFSVEVDGGGRPRSEQRMIVTYRSVSMRSKCTVHVLAGFRGECQHAARWSWHWPSSAQLRRGHLGYHAATTDHEPVVDDSVLWPAVLKLSWRHNVISSGCRSCTSR